MLRYGAMTAPAKRLKIFGVVVLFVLVLAAVVFAAVAFTNHQSRADTVSDCSTVNTDHQVIIEHDKMTPDHVTAPLCDRLTITNKDDTNRLMAFGPHEHHVAYDGVTERLLGPGQSLTVTFNQAGTFGFHDHLHDEVRGTFTVTKQ